MTQEKVALITAGGSGMGAAAIEASLLNLVSVRAT